MLYGTKCLQSPYDIQCTDLNHTLGGMVERENNLEGTLTKPCF